jgi:hypothetical protein
MDRRTRSWIAVGVGLSIGFNLFLAALVLLGRPAREAVGQTAEGSNSLMLGTEKTAESPVCFVLDPKEKHLMVYKVDTAGQLSLTASRDIQWDLKVVDAHFPNGMVKGKLTTQPSVSMVKSGVMAAGGGAPAGAPGGVNPPAGKKAGAGAGGAPAAPPAGGAPAGGAGGKKP